MNAIQKTICASLVLSSIACGAPLWADDGERDLALEINKANGLLRGGDVDGAIGVYQQAKEHAPESADLSYNTAVAQYRKGDVTAAEQLFQATAASENDAIAAKARYNLGNCNYASALQQAEQDRPAAIRDLESAITNYRSALDIDGSDADARANIELAAQLIDKLREEQEQQEKQQNQQQQDQPQKDQQQDQQREQNQQQNQQQQVQQRKDQQQPGDSQQHQQDKEQQQQSQSSHSEKKEDQSAQNKQSAEDKAQSSDEQSKDKPSAQEQSEQKQPKQEESKPQPQEQADAAKQEQQQPRSQSDQNRQQQSAGEPSEQNPTPPTEESGDEQGKQLPHGELTAAGDEDAKSNQQDRNTGAFDPSKDGEMTQQEADKMLQAIRDRDMIRRYNRQKEELRQHVPVDRDW